MKRETRKKDKGNAEGRKGEVKKRKTRIKTEKRKGKELRGIKEQRRRKRVTIKQKRQN